MQISETKNEGLSREYSVTISAADIDKRIDGRLQEVGSTIKIPGFRPGKVPMAILRQRFSKSVMGEVLEAAGERIQPGSPAPERAASRNAAEDRDRQFR